MPLSSLFSTIRYLKRRFTAILVERVYAMGWMMRTILGLTFILTSLPLLAGGLGSGDSYFGLSSKTYDISAGVVLLIVGIILGGFYQGVRLNWTHKYAHPTPESAPAQPAQD